MIWMNAAWGVAGLMLGVLHAMGIWRSSTQPTATTAAMAMARLLIVGLALVAAAIYGGILPTAAGWALAFFTCVGLAMASKRRNRHTGAAP